MKNIWEIEKNLNNSLFDSRFNNDENERLENDIDGNYQSIAYSFNYEDEEDEMDEEDISEKKEMIGDEFVEDM